jgi:hypothetical protein
LKCCLAVLDISSLRGCSRRNFCDSLRDAAHRSDALSLRCLDAWSLPWSLPYFFALIMLLAATTKARMLARFLNTWLVAFCWRSIILLGRFLENRTFYRISTTSSSRNSIVRSSKKRTSFCVFSTVYLRLQLGLQLDFEPPLY